MAVAPTIKKTIPLSRTRNLYIGTLAVTGTYTTNGDAVDASNNERFDALIAQGAGYNFQWDDANQKLKFFYGDNNNAADSAGIELPNATDHTGANGIPFMAVGA